MKRLLKILATKRSRGLSAQHVEGKFAIEFRGRMHHFSCTFVADLLKQKYITTHEQRICISDLGLQWLEQEMGLSACSADLSVASTGVRIKQKQSRQPEYNVSESPLTRLYARRTATGRSYISDTQFEAGERFRKDFECGRLQPNISANYHRAMAGSSKTAGSAGAHEISDFALDARKRVTRAIEALGPDLSGVAVDICCFLKGLELVESERRWPPRSAKLMLRTALSTLSRHYGISRSERKASSEIIAWGSEGYRPKLTA